VEVAERPDRPRSNDRFTVVHGDVTDTSACLLSADPAEGPDRACAHVRVVRVQQAYQRRRGLGRLELAEKRRSLRAVIGIDQRENEVIDVFPVLRPPDRLPALDLVVRRRAVILAPGSAGELTADHIRHTPAHASHRDRRRAEAPA
jgi:hypothetical protein